MAVPAVKVNVGDGRLGILPPTDKVLVIVASAKAGDIDTPIAFARIQDIENEFERGPLVEGAAYAIERYGPPVLLVRTAAGVAGTYGSLNLDGFTGTAEPAIDSSIEPPDEYEVYIVFVKGGTIGASGITYRSSLDGGFTLSPETALGAATSITIGDAGGIKIKLQAPEADLVAIANDVRQAYIDHISNSGGVFHTAADTTNTVSAGDATTRAEAIALLNELRADYEAHRVLTAGGVHGAADTANALTAPAATDDHSAVTLAIDLKAKFQLHRVLTAGSVHALSDTVNAITVADPSHGTIEAEDELEFTTTAPKWTTQELANALVALKNAQQPKTFIGILGPIDSAAISTIDAKLEEMAAAGQNLRATGNVRGPNAGETEAEYLASLTAALSSSSCKRLMLCAGYARIDSSVAPRRRYRRPIALALAPFAANNRVDVDLAEVDLGALPGVYIRDENGNPDEHDETINPGLDDARFTVLRTWEGRTGVYVNNPRLFSPVGSDFLWLQFGRVIDKACAVVRRELIPRLSRGVRTKTDGSGRIEEEEAKAIEADINQALGDELIAPNEATSARFVLSRTDNVLLTGKIGYETRVVPKAYPKEFEGEVALVAADAAPATGN